MLKLFCHVVTNLHFKTNIRAELTTGFKVFFNYYVVLDYFLQESIEKI